MVGGGRGWWEVTGDGPRVMGDARWHAGQQLGSSWGRCGACGQLVGELSNRQPGPTLWSTSFYHVAVAASSVTVLADGCLCLSP